MTKFYKYGDNRRTQQKFNQDITFIKYGKEIKIYDFIQENANDVNIYKNLEKYGSIENAITIMSKVRPQIIADFEKAEDLRSLEDKRILLEKAFYTLPTEIRNKFDNNLSNFIDNGYQFLKDITKPTEKPIETPIETPTETKGGQNNGTEK